jgi:uncharacterized protein (DUF1697 family)
MTTYVALLRGINLGSHAKIAMPKLRALFESLNYAEVRTYLQSGNVVFAATTTDTSGIAAQIEQRIHQDLGLKVPVLLRTGTDLRRIAANNPFLDRETDFAKLHVTFLADEPDRQRVADIDPGFGAPDAFSVVGREIYLHCPNGYGRSKLIATFFERRLKVGATNRNWKTVMALYDLANEEASRQ